MKSKTDAPVNSNNNSRNNNVVQAAKYRDDVNNNVMTKLRPDRRKKSRPRRQQQQRQQPAQDTTETTRMMTPAAGSDTLTEINAKTIPSATTSINVNIADSPHFVVSRNLEKQFNEAGKDDDDDDDDTMKKNKEGCCCHQDKESFGRAIADIELLQAAYPDELTIHSSHDNDFLPTSFPLLFTLTLPSDCSICPTTITMELPPGYPTLMGVQVVSYRNNSNKEAMEIVVAKIRSTSQQCLNHGEEGGLACCSSALDTWLQFSSCHNNKSDCCSDNDGDKIVQQQEEDVNKVQWISASTTLTDRKSVFQAHVCEVNSEDMVSRALNKLFFGENNSNKIQRATHNMYAYRFTTTSQSNNSNTIITYHDNSDDGEDGAGSRLAHLLEMRNEDGVLIVVSRWYGGIQLGPKRFAHIINVARELLVEYHHHRLDCNNNGQS